MTSDAPQRRDLQAQTIHFILSLSRVNAERLPLIQNASVRSASVYGRLWVEGYLYILHATPGGADPGVNAKFMCQIYLTHTHSLKILSYTVFSVLFL